MGVQSANENLERAFKRLEEGNPFAAEAYLQTAEKEFEELDEKEKKQFEKQFKEKTSRIYSLISEKIMERAEQFAEEWKDEKFSWTLAGVAEMAESAEEYAEKAGKQKPEPSEKTKKIIETVYSQFLQLDVGKARMMRERKDAHLAKSYLQMAEEILERAKRFEFYTEKEASEWKKKIEEEKKKLEKE
ncbi:hypothetical protein HY992_05935 [Candidatus Micrarchaeota archaeon]|nr:hypothetical protein [Candidatus Micrarchaeota archaeon]